VGIAWGAAALWFDGPSERWLAGLLAAVFGALGAGILLRVRPYARALLLAAASVGVLAGWWLSVPARNDRNWLADVSKLPVAAFDGGKVTVQNVRNFEYRSKSDYDERWETRTYDLEQLRRVDLFLSFWGPTAIAHTIASWEFADGSHLAISIEARKEKGEPYSAFRGFFRQFEVYYVVADERDVVALRATHRGETVYLYRLRTSPEKAKAILLDYLREINALANAPRWYNAITHNCTTAIRYHARQVGLSQPLDWRLFANGHLPELAYERGMIDSSLPLETLRRRSDITEKARAAGQDPMFSTRIRQGLPSADTAR
jgi:hypothetical protein